jgi:hypothetical protein
MTRHRSAVTGRFVAAWYALRHPRTTVSERSRKRKGTTKVTINEFDDQHRGGGR